MIEPLHFSFMVECAADHAFATFTRKTATWWPAIHTVSRQARLSIVFEERVGGRIFERTRAGDEFDWGVVTEWDPPSSLGYRWHINTDPGNATDVEIAFTAVAPTQTRVDIKHDGWDRLADFGVEWRERNIAGWDGTIGVYTRACLQPG